MNRGILVKCYGGNDMALMALGFNLVYTFGIAILARGQVGFNGQLKVWGYVVTLAIMGMLLEKMGKEMVIIRLIPLGLATVIMTSNLMICTWALLSWWVSPLITPTGANLWR